MIYRLLYTLLLERVDPELAHNFAARTVGLASRLPLVTRTLARLLAPRDPRLRVRAFGKEFRSPLGAAAGVDKDAAWFEGLGALGFGFVEIGTITAQPQPGNDGERLRRLSGEHALQNRMGFPNPGARAAAERLVGNRGLTPVGVNIGRSKHADTAWATSDYRETARWLACRADYVVLNVSSPNTAGLRALQALAPLRELVSGVQAELEGQDRAVPLLVKIAPDLDDAEIDAVADLAVELGIAGIVAVNTTTDAGVVRHPEQLLPTGGISGRPLKDRALAVLERLYDRVGDRVVLISVGGIESADDVIKRVRAGATLVQAYTGFVYGGPLWPYRLNRDVARALRADGIVSLQSLVGVDRPLRRQRAAATPPAGVEPASRA